MVTLSSPAQQIDALRPAVNSGLAATMHYWMIGSALALGLLSLVLWHPVPLMIGLFLGIVGLSEQSAGPNIAAAINAYDHLTPTLGEVVISSSEGDSMTHYQARVSQAGEATWEYAFIPQGWTPQDGRCPAHIWRAASGQAPLLCAVDAGVLIPRNTPKRVL